MRIITWNINSVRLRIPALAKVCAILDPDVVCLQETKVPDDMFPSGEITDLGFNHIIHSGMKSYNGVAILSKDPVKLAKTKKWCGKTDCRHIAANLSNGIELHNFYVPAGGDIPDRTLNKKFDHKLQFLSEMQDWFFSMPKADRILVGDLNIAPLEHDVWSHKQLLKVVSHTPIEVDALFALQNSNDWIDTVRYFIPPEKPVFTWWSYRNRRWPGNNRGRRLDHIWATKTLAPRLKNAGVFTQARGWEKPSDHVPVLLDIVS
tara:strand:- start:1168 stop:1953 length:786 start_codon:yes stop_codon:yes gene_type:complete